MSELAIDVKGLSKEFDKKKVVNHISLQVKKGSIFGFLGSNGSGKTTTIRMLCGLLTPSDGEGSCLGFNIRTDSLQIKKCIGYMPQKFSLYVGLSVYENLRFIASVYQVKNKKTAIKSIIEDLELEPYQSIKAGSLSGGWKQRLALACCLLNKPQLVFLDEPTAGVDPKARKDFWNYLYKISSRDGTTILVTTHYMDEAEKCTDLAYINLGNLLYSGTTKDLLPFSKVKTYILNEDYKVQNKIIDDVHQNHPKLNASVVNNELRISSRNYELLQEFLQAHSKYRFSEVGSSFEEVFIGLMK